MGAYKSHVMSHAKGIVITHIEVSQLGSHFRSADFAHEECGLPANELVRVVGTVFQDFLIIAVIVMFQKVKALQTEHIFVTIFPSLQEKRRQVIVIQCI